MLPMRFPRPENMAQGDISVWTNWIREETDEIMKQLEEERIPEAILMIPSMVLQTVSSNPYRTHYHYHLQYRRQKDKEITAKVQNIFKIREKTLKSRTQ